MTIEWALACVQSRRKKAGFPLNAEGGRLTLRTYRKERAKAGTRPRKAPPAELTVLRAMIDGCDPATLTGLRDRAALVLGFALMGRLRNWPPLTSKTWR